MDRISLGLFCSSARISAAVIKEESAGDDDNDADDVEDNGNDEDDDADTGDVAVAAAALVEVEGQQHSESRMDVEELHEITEAHSWIVLTVKLLAGSICENKADAVLDCVDDSLDTDDTDNRLRRWYCCCDGLCARRINDGVDGDGRKEDLPKKCMPMVLVFRRGD